MGSDVKITYDLDAMQKCANKLSSSVKDLERLKNKLDGTKGTLAAGWKGLAADYFQTEYLEPLKESLQVYQEMVDEFTAILNNTIARYKTLTEEAEKLSM